jgi:N-acetylmuramoyl-L-alanine amidase
MRGMVKMQTISDKTIKGIPVRVNLVPVRNPRVTPNYPMNPSFITVHNTGNAGTGANADAHMRLLHRNSSNSVAPYASYHFVVDDKEIIQLISLDRSAWHTGDGSGLKSGNRTSIGIEICMNRDGNYAKAEANAVELIRYLVQKTGISYANVVPHQKWSGKYCPAVILARTGGWAEFHKGLPVTVSAPKPSVSVSQPTGTQKYTVVSGDTLYGIAKDFKTTVAKIKSDNGLKSDTIQPGQSLFVKEKEAPKDPQAGKRVEAIVNDLTFYNKPTWDKKYSVGTVDKGLGFTIVKKVKVDDAYQYEVKNSKGVVYYITASTKYVKVV